MEAIIKFIHTGDIHLGVQFSNVSFSREKAMDRRLELWSTFQRIVDYSVEQDVDFLFIAGDLFEADYFTIGDINKVRDIFAMAKDIKILISAGNHDFIDKKSLYNKVTWTSNVTIFNSDSLESKYYPDLKTRVYGYSWDRMEFKENTIFAKDINLDEKINNILLLHGDIRKESNYLPISLESLEALKMDYIALGHIHKPNLFSHKIAYCGSPEPLDFGEQGNRGIIKGSIDKGSTMIEFIPFSKRCFHEKTIEINGNDSYFDIINKIKSCDLGNIERDFYRIILDGFVQNDMDLSNLVRELSGFYYIEILNKTTPDYDLDSIEESNRNNIIGHYIRAMKEKNLDEEVVKDALYIGLSALLKVRE